MAFDSVHTTSANGARKRRLKRRTITAPPGFTAVATSGEDVTLNWEPSEGVYVDGYKILRDGVEIIDVPVVFAGVYGDMSLTPGTLYSYAIYAYNRFGGQSPQSTVEVTTLNE